MMGATAATAPRQYAAIAAALEEANAHDTAVRFQGGGTKAAWGRQDVSGGQSPGHGLELATAGLNGIVEHNVGDFTAVLQAGVRLVDAQAVFAAEGQMLALDPPLGGDGGATVGGVLATGDSGPLRHRYGAARDLVLGMTVALADGTVARAGGKVIKNVAGYDLAKLFTGSFGTLGAIVEAVVRLHPLPPTTATLAARSDDPAALAGAAHALARAPLELEALDVEWADGRGALAARFAGATAPERADAARATVARAGLDAEVLERDESLWDAQRERQRSAAGTVVRVSALPSQLDWTLRTAARQGASLVGRAGLGLSWIRLPPASTSDTAAAVEDLRRELAPSPCLVLDAPAAVRERSDPWGARDPALRALARRVKEHFDPRGVCNRGIDVA